MSAEIEYTDGRANVLGRETWWHRLNVGLERNATWSDVQELAPALTLGVKKVSMRDLIIDPTVTVPEDIFGILREDGKLLSGGAGTKYETIDPEAIYTWALEMVQVINGTDREDLLISAGSIREGRQGFFVFEAEAFEVNGVKFEGMHNVLFSHDGTIPVRDIPSREATVCANTFDMNLRNASAFMHRHTQKAPERMAQALAAQKLAMQTEDSFRATVEKLQLRKVTGKEVDTWVAELCPLGTEAKPVSTRQENANTAAQDAIYSLFNAPLNDGVEGTGWAFVQAVNSYEQWNAPTRKTKGLGSETTRAIRQFDSLLRGQPMTAKAKELVLA